MLNHTTRLHLFASGALAGFITVVAMLLARSLTGEPSMIEVLGEAVIQTMPVAAFAIFLQTLQQAAKPLLVASIMTGFVLAGGGLGQQVRGAAHEYRWIRRVRGALLLAVGLWVPSSIIAVVITSFGAAVPLETNHLLRLIVALAGQSLVYALALFGLYPVVASALTQTSTRVDDGVDAPAADPGRRRLLAALGVGTLAIGSLGYTGRFVLGIRGGAIGGRRGGIPEAITPTGEFYVISKNFVDPRVEHDEWRLDITGLVELPQRLSFVDLAALPAQEQVTTLTCISNTVGGDLISNARWTGVPLAQLLDLARLKPGATEVVLYAHDGYTESLPLAKALESTTLLVYLMNGEPLPTRHGYPARLIVPGKYGIKNVKWLRRIDVIAGDYRGFWQQRGWTDDATIQTQSRIDVPDSRSILALVPHEIGGIAFAGDRGIRQVEWSADGGALWQPADSLEEVGPLAWVIWRSTWNPERPGSYRLLVRATDGGGRCRRPRAARPSRMVLRGGMGSMWESRESTAREAAAVVTPVVLEMR
jgi:hypothetical protein